MAIPGTTKADQSLVVRHGPPAAGRRAASPPDTDRARPRSRPVRCDGHGLDLPVETTQIQNVAIRQISPDRPSCTDAHRVGRRRIGYEFFRGQLGPVQVVWASPTPPRRSSPGDSDGVGFPRVSKCSTGCWRSAYRSAPGRGRFPGRARTLRPPRLPWGRKDRAVCAEPRNGTPGSLRRQRLAAAKDYAFHAVAFADRVSPVRREYLQHGRHKVQRRDALRDDRCAR